MKDQAETPLGLPTGWKISSLAKLSSIFTDGNWIEMKDEVPAGTRLVQTEYVGTGDFKDRREKARSIDNETFERLKCFEVFPNDIPISRLPDPVSCACKIPDTGERMVTAIDCSMSDRTPTRSIRSLDDDRKRCGWRLTAPFMLDTIRSTA